MKAPNKATERQIRGSALLLTGTVFGRLLNGVAQIILARSLSKAGYGAFAYGVATVGLGDVFVTLGVNQAITRFVPVYEEKRQYGKALGTLVLVFGTIATLGIGAVLAVTFFTGEITRLFVRDPLTASLLSILVVLIPIESFNRAFDGLLAVIGRPGLIFARKNVLAPVLRIAAVTVIVLTGAGVRALALAYVAIGVAGLATYVAALPRAIQQHGLPVRRAWQELELPIAELVRYVIPLFISAVAWAVLESLDALVLGHYEGTVGVATLRSVLPLAHLIQAVRFSFTLLFTASVARLYARLDRQGINDAYWQTVTWIAVLSFPLLALEVVFSSSVVTALYGSRYASSAPILAILATGYFLQATIGLSHQVLAVFRQVNYVLWVNLTMLVTDVVLMFVLIPRFGALGAALARLAAIAVTSLWMQQGMHRRTGVRLVDATFAPAYLAMGVALAALWAAGELAEPPLAVSLVITGAASLGLLVGLRKLLQIDRIFPEIRRIPIVRFLAVEPDPTETEDEH